MSLPNNTLPLKDQYTSYDYTLGAERLSAVENKQVQIEYLNETIQALAFQKILNNPFNDQLRFTVAGLPCQIAEQALRPKLKITYPGNAGDIKSEVNALSRKQTIEFSRLNVERWEDEAEKVLSATETGSLYWNILYHFGSFKSFLHHELNEDAKQ